MSPQVAREYFEESLDSEEAAGRPEQERDEESQERHDSEVSYGELRKLETAGA